MGASGRRGRRPLLRFLLGSGPLKRGTDRVEMTSRLLLLLALLLTAPAAALCGIAAHGHLLGIARVQVAERHAVSAVVLTDPQTGSARDAENYSQVVDATVRWVTATGDGRTATVAVPSTAHAGDRVPLWISRSGARTTPPFTREAADTDSLSLGAAVMFGLPLVAWGLHGLTRMLLDARRARQWGEGWLAVEPLWAQRRW
jgi:hypothetical protein